jgi:hypothetical protein
MIRNTISNGNLYANNVMNLVVQDMKRLTYGLKLKWEGTYVNLPLRGIHGRFDILISQVLKYVW